MVVLWFSFEFICLFFNFVLKIIDFLLKCFESLLDFITYFWFASKLIRCFCRFSFKVCRFCCKIMQFACGNSQFVLPWNSLIFFTKFFQFHWGLVDFLLRSFGFLRFFCFSFAISWTCYQKYMECTIHTCTFCQVNIADWFSMSSGSQILKMNRFPICPNSPCIGLACFSIFAGCQPHSFKRYQMSQQ